MKDLGNFWRHWLSFNVISIIQLVPGMRGVTTKLKTRLQIAQNKMVRFVLGMGPRVHIGQTELAVHGGFRIKS